MNIARIRDAACGRWPDILPRLGVPGDSLTGKHGPCPGCGGRDRFRFDDRDGRGTWICGGGGAPIAGDGFALLQHIHGWDFPRTLAEVASLLGIQPDSKRPAPRSTLGTVAEIEAAAWHEIHVLAVTLGVRVTDRGIANAKSFRYLHPEWRPMPPEPWDRELQAARRLLRLLPEVYPELNGRAAA